MKSVSNVTALKICLAVHEAGGTAYLVGGLVRDMLIDRESRDWDLEVFGITRGTLVTILNRYAMKSVDFVGEQYGVYKVDGDLDVSLPRRDKGHGHGADVEIDPTMTVEEASLHRDLTINSMYFNPITAQVIDPHNGRHSLFNRVVRHVSDETFHEDPLRPVRAARIAAVMNFDVDYNTIQLCRNSDTAKVAGLPKERVLGELTKVLLEAPKPSVFFDVLDQMRLMEIIFPELHSMMNVEQGKAYHPEGNVLNHSLLALDSVPMHHRELDVMLAIMMHDFGKPLVPNEVDGDKIHFHGHAEELANAKSAIARLTNEDKLTKSVLNLVENHMKPYNLKKNNCTKKMVRRLASQTDFTKLMAVHIADRAGRGLPKERRAEDNIAPAERMMELYNEIASEIKPVLTGRHLIAAGFEPGDHFGTILKELYDRQLDEQFSTIEEGVKLVHTLFGNLKKKIV